jgi:hypothetical protein
MSPSRFARTSAVSPPRPGGLSMSLPWAGSRRFRAHPSTVPFGRFAATGPWDVVH